MGTSVALALLAKEPSLRSLREAFEHRKLFTGQIALEIADREHLFHCEWPVVLNYIAAQLIIAGGERIVDSELQLGGFTWHEPATEAGRN